MLIKVNTLLVYHEYTSDPLACKINHTVEVASITNSLNPFSVTRMTPKLLFLFSLAPHTLRFALAKSFTGCDLSLKPLGSPTLTHKTHTHTHTHTTKTVVSSSQCFISLPVSAQSPTGNDIHTEMCTDIKCTSETTHRYNAQT